jgi:hypothetical protein
MTGGGSKSRCDQHGDARQDQGKTKGYVHLELSLDGNGDVIPSVISETNSFSHENPSSLFLVSQPSFQQLHGRQSLEWNELPGKAGKAWEPDGGGRREVSKKSKKMSEIGRIQRRQGNDAGYNV